MPALILPTWTECFDATSDEIKDANAAVIGR